jgi:hypothetical protein
MSQQYAPMIFHCQGWRILPMLCHQRRLMNGYSNVSFAGIDNNSGTTGYSDFTQFTGAVDVGEEYPITVTVHQWYGFSWTETVRVWIDWNQDFNFDLDEYYDLGSVRLIPANSSSDFTTVIQVPMDAERGHTRMRVILSSFSYKDTACGQFLVLAKSKIIQSWLVLHPFPCQMRHGWSVYCQFLPL